MGWLSPTCAEPNSAKPRLRVILAPVATWTAEVPRDLRNDIKKRYPGLGDHPGYWRMLGYILFPSRFEAATGRPIISAATVAALAGKVDQQRNRNFRAGSFLAAFKKHVVPGFTYSRWHHYKSSPFHQRKARTILGGGLDPVERQAWRDRVYDAILNDEPDRVYLDTGRKIGAREAQRRREEIETQIDAMNLGHADVVIRYHNALNVGIFTKKVNAGRQEAFAQVRAEPESPSQQQALSVLVHIVSAPKPYLRPVERSDRAFSYQPSLSTVRRDMRSILTRGWYEYDLRSAQLAIAASVWGIPELRTALERPDSVWQQFADGLGVPLEPNKDGIKTAIYALLFGAAPQRVKQELNQGTGDPTLYDRFKKLALIKALYRARNLRLSQILTAGGLTTIFGDHLPALTRAEARSVLAQEAQAAELDLMLPIYELAQAHTARFGVVLYQFDGVHVKYRDKAAAGTYDRRIKEAVAKKAENLDIITELEGKEVA